MPVVRQLRGPVVEAVHPYSVALVVDPTFGTPATIEGPDLVTTYRSSAKPFQLAVALEALGDARFDDDELALGAASHSAQPRHLAVVERLLARFGLHEHELRCGAHPPMHAPSAEAILRADGRFTNLHNNCSGKHTFMLAACVAQGWSREYLAPEHPLQARVATRVAEVSGVRGELATDGCGVPTFGLPLSAIARGWAVVADAMRDPAGPHLGRIGWAMARHPDLTSGDGRLDLDVVRHMGEPVAVKIGAQGLFCLAFPQRRLGVAIKVSSGSGDALAAATSATLARLVPESWREPEAWALRDLRNVVGRSVGTWSAD